MQVLSQSIADVIRDGVCSQGHVEQIVGRNSLRWPLPPELCHRVLVIVNSYCEEVSTHEVAIEDFLYHHGPRTQPSVAYAVFHHSRSHFFYDELPPEILALRETLLFWIDHSTNKYRSRGQPLGTGEGLQPKAEEMLRYPCQIEHAGRTISFSDLFMAVWRPVVLPEPALVHNNIGVQQNAINAFAVEKFITTAPPNQQRDELKIYRLRGKERYAIGTHAYEELCIIRNIHRQWSPARRNP